MDKLDQTVQKISESSLQIPPIALDQTVQKILDSSPQIPPTAIATIQLQHIARNENYDITDSLNMSGMFSKLIQDTGRFTENYASDLLISIDSFKENASNLLCSLPRTTVTSNTFIGIRKNGVDGEEYIYSNLSQAAKERDHFTFNNTYRRIYAIHLRIEPNSSYGNVIWRYEASVWLIDITDRCEFPLFVQEWGSV